MELAQRSVLLTGASGGLGLAIARRLAREQARLVLSGRRTEVLNTLAEEVAGLALPADLTRRDDVQRLLAELPDVDVLVSNAALPGTGHLDDYSTEQIDHVLDTNLRAPVMLARRLIERMKGRGEGQLVFIGSLGGKAASVNAALYSATKFGLRGFAHSLRADLHGTGVGVSLVLPGPIRDAGMWAETGAKLPRGTGTRSPDQVATAVVRAVRKNRAEIVVASFPTRLGSAVAGVAPRLMAAVQRRGGSAQVMEAAAEAQRSKR